METTVLYIDLYKENLGMLLSEWLRMTFFLTKGSSLGKSIFRCQPLNCQSNGYFLKHSLSSFFFKVLTERSLFKEKSENVYAWLAADQISDSCCWQILKTFNLRLLKLSKESTRNVWQNDNRFPVMTILGFTIETLESFKIWIWHWIPSVWRFGKRSVS